MAKPSTSRCIIEIQIDRPDCVYKPGDRITGRIEILPGADQKCRKVTLTARWAARGKGPEDAADAETVLLPGGTWRNNEKVTHPFDFAAPSAPLSYEGDSFDIRWYLEATADLPHTKDATAVRKFTLTHGQRAAGEQFSWQTAGVYNPFAALGSDAAKGTAKRRDKPPALFAVIGWIPALFFLLVLVVIVLYLIGSHELDPDRGYVSDVIWSVAILGGVLAMVGVFRRMIQAKRREAVNRLRVRPPEPGAKLPHLPGKFWLKSLPDDSQRGWPRSIFALASGGLGLILMAGGLIHAVLHAASTHTALDVATFVAGLVLMIIERRPLLLSWRFIKTSMALGRVEVVITPERHHCGEELHVAVDFRTSVPARLVEATAALEAYELAERYFLDMRTMDIDKITEMFTAHREQPRAARLARVRRIHFQAVTLAADRALLPQESASLSGMITVPAEAPPTFLAVENKILWFLAVRLNLASGTRWSRDIPIFLQQ